MLAAQLERHGSAGDSAVAVVALSDDKGAAAAVEGVSGALGEVDRPRLITVWIEDILAATNALSPEPSWWATSFGRRYVETGLPDDASAQRDPEGPVLGRSLHETVNLAR